jgi:2-haloacid dehalogenase
MTTQITAVVFDLGGVLIDWNPRYLYRKLIPDETALERFLAEVCTPAWNATLDAGRPFADGIAELVARFPEQAELIEAYGSRWEETLGEAVADSPAIVRRLVEAGVPTYALSNWARETFDTARAHFPFLDEFTGILISGDVRVAKPDPAMFRLFLDRFGLRAGETIFIDDSAANVAAARALGIVAIKFENADQTRRELAGLGLPL